MAEKISIRGKNAGDGEANYSIDYVVSGLISLLETNQIDRAVDIYMRCNEDVGFPLLSRAQKSDALYRQAANLLYRARDYAKAAMCCEQLGEIAKAASLYERAGDHAQAAHMYASIGEKRRAAEMLEKCNQLVNAARLYESDGDKVHAAQCWERAQEYVRAATLYMDAAKWDRAQQALLQVGTTHPDFRVAQELRAKVDANLASAPAQHAPALPDLEQTATIQQMPRFELPALGVSMGGPVEERRGTGTQIAPQVLSPFASSPNDSFLQDPNEYSTQYDAAPVAFPADPAPQPNPTPEPSLVTPSAIDLQPISLSDFYSDDQIQSSSPNVPQNISVDGASSAIPKATNVRPAMRVTSTVVKMMEGFDFIRKLPLFSELSLDDLRTFYRLCEIRNVATETPLTTQGKTPEAMWVILDGNALVYRDQAIVATLGEGDHIGDMSLLDDSGHSAASATVLTEGDARLLRLDRAGFLRILNTNDAVALRIYRAFARELAARLRDANIHLAQWVQWNAAMQQPPTS